MKKIFVIGSYSDKTTRYTGERLKSNKVDFEFIDIGLVSAFGDLSFDPINLEGKLVLQGRTHIFNSDSRFYARILDISSAAKSEELKLRCQRVQLLFSNMLDVLDSKVINPPNRANYNLSKLFHLGQVKTRSLLVPPSLCTTEKSKVINFCERHQWDVIVKGCSSSKTVAQKVTRDCIDRLDLIKSAPPLFQKRIDGVEMRVHTISGQSFAELIATEETDYRFPTHRSNVVTFRVKVDQAIEDDMKAISKQLALPMIGVDLKLDETKEAWYFLEANPIPCYYGYDIRSGYRISKSICDFLAG